MSIPMTVEDPISVIVTDCLTPASSMKNQHRRPNRPNRLRARKSLESIVSVVISLMTNTTSRYHLHLGNMQDFEQYTGMTISICSVTFKLITVKSV